MSAAGPSRVAGFYVQKSLGGLNPKLANVSSLKGKTVFVSGGSRGIGLAIGIRAAREGANVVIAGVPPPFLQYILTCLSLPHSEDNRYPSKARWNNPFRSKAVRRCWRSSPGCHVQHSKRRKC
jgi:hypothetical protein